MSSSLNNDIVLYTAQGPSAAGTSRRIQRAVAHGAQAPEDINKQDTNEQNTNGKETNEQDTGEPTKNQKTTLSTLPTDIILLVSDHLNPIESTCLALALKSFYPFHRAKHGKVSLLECPRNEDPPLAVLLKSYFPGLIYYPIVNKFVTFRRRVQLDWEWREQSFDRICDDDSTPEQSKARRGRTKGKARIWTFKEYNDGISNSLRAPHVYPIIRNEWGLITRRY